MWYAEFTPRKKDSRTRKRLEKEGVEHVGAVVEHPHPCKR